MSSSRRSLSSPSHSLRTSHGSPDQVFNLSRPSGYYYFCPQDPPDLSLCTSPYKALLSVYIWQKDSYYSTNIVAWAPSAFIHKSPYYIQYVIRPVRSVLLQFQPLSLSPASPAELNKLLPFRLCMNSTASVLITLNYSLLPVLPFLTTTSTTKEPFVMHLLQTTQQFITEPPHNSPHLSFKATKTDSTANVLLIALLVSHSQRQRATAQIAE